MDKTSELKQEVAGEKINRSQRERGREHVCNFSNISTFLFIDILLSAYFTFDLEQDCVFLGFRRKLRNSWNSDTSLCPILFHFIFISRLKTTALKFGSRVALELLMRKILNYKIFLRVALLYENEEGTLMR